MENGSKMTPKSIPGIIKNHYLSRPFPKVDFLGSALARRPAYTLRMYTLIRMLAPCLASALSRYHPGWDPTPRTPPPGTPPLTPQGPPPPTHPTPHHPTPPPASPSGRLFQVDGYSKWMVIPSAWLSQGVKIRLNKQGRAQTQSMQKALTALVGSLYLLSSHNAAPLVRISPRSTPRAPQEHPGAHQEHPVAPRSTREHPGALEPV